MKVNDFLSAVGKDSMDLQQAWVSDGETPLKWHYPIGLLHDLYNLHSQIWSLTLNEGNFPGKLLRIDYVEIMQDIFMSTCKEAECIRNGSVKRFINLSTSDQSQLWKTVENGFLEQDMNNYLDIQKGLTVGENGTYRSIPLRLYLEDGTIVRKLIQNFGSIGDVMKELEITFSKLILHGLDLHKETPIDWLYQQASFADSFLHIVVQT